MTTANSNLGTQALAAFLVATQDVKKASGQHDIKQAKVAGAYCYENSCNDVQAHCVLIRQHFCQEKSACNL